MFNMDPSKQVIGWLCRHGELTNMNIWDSWGDYDLSEEGRQQAAAIARWLSFEKIGRVVSSDVPRTMHTAEYLMDTGAVQCSFMACDPNLRPWMVAHFTGQTKTPERLAEFQKYLDNPDLVIPGGESLNQLNARVQVVFQYLCAPYKALPTAVFIHNSVIKALMGLSRIKEACSPGGIVQVTMNEKGEIDFDVILGRIEPESGIS